MHTASLVLAQKTCSIIANFPQTNIFWNLFVYTFTYLYIKISFGTCQSIFSNILVPKVTFQCYSAFRLLLWLTKLHLQWLHGSLYSCSGPQLGPLAWTGAHRMHLLVQLLLCCLQYDHQEFISAYCQKDRGKKPTPLTESSTLNYHGVFLSTIITLKIQ